MEEEVIVIKFRNLHLLRLLEVEWLVGPFELSIECKLLVVIKLLVIAIA